MNSVVLKRLKKTNANVKIMLAGEQNLKAGCMLYREIANNLFIPEIPHSRVPSMKCYYITSLNVFFCVRDDHEHNSQVENSSALHCIVSTV